MFHAVQGGFSVQLVNMSEALVRFLLVATMDVFVQVKRLQVEKQWLEEQVNPVLQVETCACPTDGAAVGRAPPIRHLSI